MLDLWDLHLRTVRTLGGSIRKNTCRTSYVTSTVFALLHRETDLDVSQTQRSSSVSELFRQFFSTLFLRKCSSCFVRLHWLISFRLCRGGTILSQVYYM